MKYLFVFLGGVAAGVVAALLFAPKSGEDLRDQIHDEAIRDQERIRLGYENARQAAQERIEQVQSKLPTDDDKSMGETAEEIIEEITPEMDGGN